MDTKEKEPTDPTPISEEQTPIEPPDWEEIKKRFKVYGLLTISLISIIVLYFIICRKLCGYDGAICERWFASFLILAQLCVLVTMTWKGVRTFRGHYLKAMREQEESQGDSQEEKELSARVAEDS